MKIYIDNETNRKLIEETSLSFFYGKFIKDMDKDELIYTIAHLSSPTTPFLKSIEIIEKNTKIQEEHKEYTENIIKQIEEQIRSSKYSPNYTYTTKELVILISILGILSFLFFIIGK